MRVARHFFDGEAVRKHLTRKKRKSLSRQGAFVRRAARSLLRKRKRSAAPGQPPSVHTSGRNLRTILFAYEPSTGAVVVGPVRFNTKNNAAQLNEHGGTATVTSRKGRRRRVRYAKHPFMGPALKNAAASPKFIGPWEE